jgi:C4-dicarboxylate-specific signal transduction histidine kinase
MTVLLHAFISIFLIALFILFKRITLPTLTQLQTSLLFLFTFFWYFAALFVSPNAIIVANVAQFVLMALWSILVIFIVRGRNRRKRSGGLESAHFPRATDLFGTNKDQVLLQTQLMRAAHMASLGTLAAGIAHEINNPLGVLMGYIRIMDKRAETMPPATIRETLAKQLAAAERIASIVKRVRAFASPSPLPSTPTNVLQCLKSALELVANRYSRENVRLQQTYSCEAEEMALVNIQQLEQALLNILMNAADAVIRNDAKSVDVEVTAKDNFIKIRIGDNGGGIPETISDRIFDPFFTTKPLGENLGLGLSVVNSTVRNAGGKVYFENRVSGGTNFFVELLKAK